MSGEEIIKEIDNLDKNQRDKVLKHIIQKYFKDTFIVDSSYNWSIDDRNYITVEVTLDEFEILKECPKCKEILVETSELPHHIYKTCPKCKICWEWEF